MTTRCLVFAGFVVIALGALVACSAPGSQVGAQPLGLAPKNIARWSLPLDPYIETEHLNTAYARELLMRPCMSRHGVDFHVAFRELAPDGDDTFTSSGRRIFSVEIARAHGYRIVDEFGGLARPEMTEAEGDAYSACAESAKRQFLRVDPISDLGSQLAGEAYNATLDDPAVRAASKRWVACMRPLGISDLGKDPTSMPSLSVMDRFGLNEDGYKTPHSSAEEVALAVADATCQESSGYFSAFYDGESKRQVEMLAENADELARIKAQLDADHKSLRGVIAKNPVTR